jgi:hypothetical protein
MLNNKKLYPFLFVLVGLLLGCVAPFQGQPTQSGLAPVDMTVTAVLKVLFTSTAAALPVNSATLPASATPESAFTIQPSDTTAPVTPTPADTETPEPARIRSGPSLVVAYLDQPPVLDGIWDEWTTTSYTATNLVYGAAQMTDRNDLGASFRVGWDNKYLYLAVKVGDDAYVQRDTLANIYNGDSIEISLDTELQADFESSQLNSDDYQVRISPGNPDPGKHPEAYLWFPRNISTSLSQVKIGAVGGQDLYRLEAALPWSVFDITPQPGMHFGFVLRVNDDDEVELNIQQSAVASVKGASPADPTTWGDFVLEK